MHLAQFLTVFAAANQIFLVAVCAQAAKAPAECPVTLPDRSTPPGEKPGPNYYGNGSLWTTLSTEGRVMFRSGGPGQIQSDGSMSMKFWWWRAVVGKLSMQGRRLNAPAPPLRAHIPEGYGDTGFQVTSLIFPTEGCWEVVGKAGDAELKFVTLVSKTESK